MTKWQYEILTYGDHETLRQALNAYGRDGWEAISANYVIDPGSGANPDLPGSTAHHIWIAVCKRPLQD
jgi:hypothetical protein